MYDIAQIELQKLEIIHHVDLWILSMTSQPLKCAHQSCSCMITEVQKWCSTSCMNAEAVAQNIQCECGHSECIMNPTEKFSDLS